MGEYKPLGSEKLSGDAKMKRILELTYYKPTDDSQKSDEVIKESTTGVYAIKKENSNWDIAFVTVKGVTPPCLLIGPFNFPKEIVGQCTNPDGTVKVVE